MTRGDATGRDTFPESATIAGTTCGYSSLTAAGIPSAAEAMGAPDQWPEGLFIVRWRRGSGMAGRTQRPRPPAVPLRWDSAAHGSQYLIR